MSSDLQQKLRAGPFVAFDEKECAAIERAIAERRAVRGFETRPVSRELIERILDIAARAPSGTNMQPWRVYVLAGEAKRGLSDAIARERVAPANHREGEYRYYPEKFFEPYLSRRRKIGWDLYGLVGIKRGDDAAMHAQHGKNFDFFGAPIGAIFTIDRRLEIGSWLDYGMFLENVMIAARAHGLETCPQAAFASFHDVVRANLGIDEGEVVVCGMAIGYPDWSAPENKLETTREAAASFTSFRGL
ncbi:MAG: nitroreductase [Methylobacteriaceae bacterium]|nr:nitroreductase [Methylobacteriaceae bacterium]